MTVDQANIPNVAEIMAGVLRKVEPKLQPVLLAKLERLQLTAIEPGLAISPLNPQGKACLPARDREEEIARRVESLVAGASAIQDKLLSDHPELADLNRTLFDGRPLKVQFAIQAEGERAGAAAWRAYAAAASEQSVQELLKSCSPLEQANADFLQTLL
jgi:hypothetical protein